MISDAHMLQIATAVAKLFELAGLAVIVAGTVVAMAKFGLDVVARSGADADPMSASRRRLGRSILTGLELLVAADIIRTVAIEPTMESVLVLGIIVLIRTFLSFSLEVEIEGRWPWQQKPDRSTGNGPLSSGKSGPAGSDCAARRLRTGLRFRRSRPGRYAPRSPPWAGRAWS